MQVKMELSIDFLLNHTWSGGYETLDTIIEHNKGQELIDLLEDLFVDVTDITTLNDFLWFDREFIFEQLEIEL